MPDQPDTAAVRPLGQRWTSRMCEREYHTLCRSDRCACPCHGSSDDE